MLSIKNVIVWPAWMVSIMDALKTWTQEDNCSVLPRIETLKNYSLKSLSPAFLASMDALDHACNRDMDVRHGR